MTVTDRDAPASAPVLRLPHNRRPVPTSTRLRTRRLPVLAYIAAIVLLPALVVAGGMAVGQWQLTGRGHTGAEGSADSASVNGTGASGKDQAAAQTPTTPQDIKGWMTVQDVLTAFPSVTAAQLLAELNAPPDTPTAAQLKTVAESGGVDVPTLRTWLTAQVSTPQGAGGLTAPAAPAP